MKFRALVLGTVLVLVCTVAAWAGTCVLCGAPTAAGEKYCAYHKGRIFERGKEAEKEKGLVDAVKKAREDYEKALVALNAYYKESGEADRIAQAANELKDLQRVRKYNYQGAEETYVDLNPTKDIPAATAIYDQAESKRTQVLPPWGRDKRLKDAINLYTEVIEKYPDSKLVSAAAYRIGGILESVGFVEYQRAARYYEYCFRWNPDTEFPARYDAARLYDEKLGKYEKAVQLYYMSARFGPDLIVRKQAELRLERLQQRGFGKDLGKEPAKEAPAPAPKAAPAAEGVK